jgi:hypothetical protein
MRMAPHESHYGVWVGHLLLPIYHGLVTVHHVYPSYESGLARMLSVREGRHAPMRLEPKPHLHRDRMRLSDSDKSTSGGACLYSGRYLPRYPGYVTYICMH